MKSFTPPKLQSLGSITDLTGTGGCYDFDPSWWPKEKDLGYPSDTNWKFLPICDEPSDSVS